VGWGPAGILINQEVILMLVKVWESQASQSQ
jgi:hypothetical protein